MPDELIQDPPQRLWLVCGSATILRALHRLWPKTHMLIVQVGRTVWEDLRQGIPHELCVKDFTLLVLQRGGASRSAVEPFVHTCFRTETNVP